MEYYGDLCLQADQLLPGSYGGVEPYEVWAGSEGALDTEYAARAAVLVDGGHRFGVSAVAFDKHEELVWSGNQGGHVTSYYGPTMQKYTSFQVHESEEVRHIVTLEEGVFALTNTALRHQIRRGLPRHTHRSENMTDMQCLLQLGRHRLLMGGHQEKLLDLDINTMKESVIASSEEGCAVMRGSGGALVACGGANGEITLRDVRCPERATHSLRAHSACLSDLDIQGDLLITAGFADGGGGVSVAEACVRVWDVRRLRGADAARAVPLPAAPLLLHFVPAVSGRAAAVAADGRALLFHVNAPPPRERDYSMLQVDTQSSPCTVFDISATSQALVFGDASGHLHLFSPHHNTDPIFNNFSRATSFADPPQHATGVSLADETFRAWSVPLPPLAAGDAYFSQWPAEFAKRVYRKPKPIDPKVLSSMKMQGPIGYAPNPRTCHRNEMPYIEEEILSADSPKRTDLRTSIQPIPRKYLKVESRYSKHGAEGELELYNKTGFPGLEATLPNSYCNPMLQVLYYTGPVKATLLAHSCAKEFCLSCELGFLFRMLDTSSGAPCQASNFLRAFRTVPEAAALGLILSDRMPSLAHNVDLIALIQSWNRFILHQMHLEILEGRKRDKEATLQSRGSPPDATTPPLHSKLSARLTSAAGAVADAAGGGEATELGPADEEFVFMHQHEGGGEEGAGTAAGGAGEEREESEISELFGIAQAQHSRCLKCDKEEERRSVVLACALQYPAARRAGDAAGGDAAAACVGFLPLLRAALASRRTTPAWCDACERFSPTAQHARVVRMPPILTINFGGVVAHEKTYWKKGTFKDNMEAARRNAPATGSNKPCRYGVHCARAGCRFKHPDRSAGGAGSAGGGAGRAAGGGEAECELPLQLRVRLLPDGELSVTDQPKACTTDCEEGEEIEYELSAAVVCVERGRNLVAYVRVDRDHWYLFNDVSIWSVRVEEVLQFGAWWKSPCVLFYESRAARRAGGGAGGEEARGAAAAGAGGARGALDAPAAGDTFTPLAPHEMPKAGTLVGMDAEFVTLNTEQVEVRSDGQHSTLRPSHMSVARITCVRGEGPLEGVPFIDDYISTQEQVVDYLTKFSGIKPGDLDANFSSKHLTTLKSTYRKLRSLVDSGVVFVGHGLNNDFRVINLVVPPEQVVDTVQLFHLPHHRMVSLKFLAWHFLGVIIQSETHDSVEDARTALRLRRKWAELGERGELRSALLELYRAGDAAGWRVPEP